jgi:flagellar basal-body rod protein FlgG
MTGGLRVAGAAMTSYSQRHDVIANNLANVSTEGFARADTFLTQLELAGDALFAPPQVETRTDFTPGTPLLTGNRFDLSLEGSGFFAIDTEAGERYSRFVSLHVNDAGFLENQDGRAVLGENGALHAGEASVSVEGDGAVFLDGEFLDRLKIVTFASGDDIERQHSGVYAARPGRAPVFEGIRPLVRPGQIEGSSVQPVAELVKMIEAMRAYEAAGSAVRATNTTLERAVNDIARI